MNLHYNSQVDPQASPHQLSLRVITMTTEICCHLFKALVKISIKSRPPNSIPKVSTQALKSWLHMQLDSQSILSNYHWYFILTWRTKKYKYKENLKEIKDLIFNEIWSLNWWEGHAGSETCFMIFKTAISEYLPHVDPKHRASTHDFIPILPPFCK